MKEIPSGTLVIIGNGFDLSHGLKTSYNDFFKHYILDCLEEASKNDPNYQIEDELFRFSCIVDEKVFNIEPDFFDKYRKVSLRNLKDKIENSHNISVLPKGGGNFPKKLYDSFDSWVDIENTYYEILKKIIKDGYKGYPEDFKSNQNSVKRQLTLLNEQMSVLTEKLHKYLSKSCNQAQKIKVLDSDFFINHYEDYFSKEKLREEYTGGNHHIHLLDFNYTNTSFMYAHNRSKGISVSVNKIHGKLDSNEYPLIFGYGDERDNDYTLIEDIQLDEAFEKIKSFGYFNTGSYENLLGFIDRGDFTVVILGHSCGLSDRVLLSTIFEHDNCKKIRVCFWGDPEGKNDFTSKTYQISRHFRDKIKMRERIIPFNPKDRIPQFDD